MSDKELRVSIILRGLDKLSGPLRDINGNAGKLTKALGATRQEIKKIESLQSSIGKFRTAEAEYLRVTEKLAEAQAKGKANVSKLTAEHERLGRQLQGMSSTLNSAGIDVAELSRHEERLAHEASDANRALKAQSGHLSKINDRRAAFQGMKERGSGMMAAGTGAVATGVAMTAPSVMAARSAISFESAMADVRKVVTMSDAEFQKLGRNVIDLSTRLPVAADGLAQIVAAGGRAGIAGSELQQFADDAARLSVAFDMLPEDAGEMVAKWRKGFALSRNGAMDLADQVNALTNKYGGNVNAVTGMVTRIGALGRVTGATASTLAAMAQVMSSVGVEEEIGATGMKNFLLAMNKGEAATKSQSAAFSSLGLNAVSVSKAMQVDARAATQDVLKRIAALPKHLQSGILTNIFGSESVAAIAPLLTNLDALDKNLDLVGNRGLFAGSAQAEFSARMATTEAQIGLTENKVKALSITMGSGTLPAVRDLGDAVGGVADRFRNWANDNPRLASGLVIFAGVMGGLVAIFGGIAIVIGGLTFALGAMGLTLGAVLLPALAIAAAVAALIAIGWLLYSNWEKIWKSVSDWASGAWATIKSLFTVSNVMSVFSPIGTMIVSGLIAGFKAAFPNAYASVANFLSGLITRAKSVLGIKSPSRVFMGLGRHIVGGLAIGIDRNTGTAVNATERMSQAVSTAGKVMAPIAALSMATSPVLATKIDGRHERVLAAAKQASAVATSATAEISSGTQVRSKSRSPVSDQPIGGSAPRPQINITIHGAPGQSEEALADKVGRIVEQILARDADQASARGRSAFSDDD